jgi:hypothetical protein
MPWTLRNAVEFGRFVPVTSGTGFALASTYNETSRQDDDHPGAFRSPLVVPEYEPLFRTPGIDEGTLDATLRRESLDFATDHPGYIAEVTGNNLLRLFEVAGDSVVGARTESGRLVPAPGRVVDARGIGSATPTSERVALALAAILSLVGVVAMVRSKMPRAPWFLWLVPIVMILAAAPINGLPRHRVPADPFLLMLAAVGVAWLGTQLRSVWKRRPPLRPAAATMGLVTLIALGGCGGEDDDPADGETAGTSTTSTTETDPEKQAYIAKAEAICRDGLREARAVGNKFDAFGGDYASPLERFTEELVVPGIPILERFASRLRALQPRPDDPDLEQYLDLLDPGIELLHQRVAAGRAGDLTESGRLEALLVELGDEQRQYGRAFGLRACDTDFLTELAKAAAD